MPRFVWDGPPWGELVEEDEAYVRGQTGSLGSGLLGGWSQANLGGFFTQDPANDVEEALHDLPAQRREPR